MHVRRSPVSESLGSLLRVNSPLEFYFQSEINCPIKEVFAFFRDIDRHAGQPDSVVPVYQKLTPGDPSVGTRYREIVRILPWLFIEIMTVLTTFQENAVLEYIYTFTGLPMEGDLAYRFEPYRGRTLLYQRQRLYPAGWLLLTLPLMQPTFALSASHRLDSIKHLLERNPSTQPRN